MSTGSAAGTTAGSTAGRASRGRRPLLLGVALLGVGVALAAGCSAGVWLRPRLGESLIAVANPLLRGRILVPAAVPLALVAAAGAVAVVSARARLLRIAAAAVLLLAGLGLVALTLRVVLDPLTMARHELAARGSFPPVLAAGSTGLGWLDVLAGLLVAAGGLLTAATGPRRVATSSRYDAPGAPAGRAAGPPGTEWDALERGEDPTAAPPSDPTAAPAGPNRSHPPVAGGESGTTLRP